MPWTASEYRNLVESGATRHDGSGELERNLPLHPEGWWRPHHVWVERGQLHWQTGDYPYERADVGPGMVEEFVDLETVNEIPETADPVDPLTGLPAVPWAQRQEAAERRQQSDPRLVAYASRWGVLGLCPHQVRLDPRASPHELTPRPTDLHRLAPLTPGAYLLHDCHEPVSTWAELARHYRAIVRIATSLHLHKTGSPEDWWRLRSYFPGESWHSAIDWEAVKRGDLLADDIEPPGLPPDLDPQWGRLAQVASAWLRVSGLAPALSPTKTGWQIAFRQQGLLGGLAGQLLIILTRASSVAVCSACSAIYVPKREPSANRRNFCPECGKTGSNRLSARDRRASKDHPKTSPAQTPARPST